MILNMKRLFSLGFTLVLLLSLLAGCDKNSGPAQSNVPKTYEMKASGGMLLPFDEKGEFVWNSSDIKEDTYAYIEYLTEGTAIESVDSYLSDEKNARAFISKINEAKKELLGTLKAGLVSSDALFAEADKGVALYRISINMSLQSVGMFVYKAADCGYLWFRLDTKSHGGTYCYSLYKIDLNSLKGLEQTVEGFEKRKEALSAKPVIYLYPENLLIKVKPQNEKSSR